jgi:ATP-binding cassette subfamily B protein
MAAGQTAVLVSHRLGAARLCDRVLVLRDGHLLEQGTHDELLAAGGEYARMWALQSRWYQGTTDAEPDTPTAPGGMS